eukprot:PLAT12502.31.p1 GENE.PLAT12502.31~~PLAT12502.31.p1  ORF type:complete len:726 (+),score=362.73 PLAT12502.31:36-2213(+)
MDEAEVRSLSSWRPSSTMPASSHALRIDTLSPAAGRAAMTPAVAASPPARPTARSSSPSRPAALPLTPIKTPASASMLPPLPAAKRASRSSARSGHSRRSPPAARSARSSRDARSRAAHSSARSGHSSRRGPPSARSPARSAHSSRSGPASAAERLSAVVASRSGRPSRGSGGSGASGDSSSRPFSGRELASLLRSKEGLLRSHFHALDADDNGTLSVTAFQSALRDAGITESKLLHKLLRSARKHGGRVYYESVLTHRSDGSGEARDGGGGRRAPPTVLPHVKASDELSEGEKRVLRVQEKILRDVYATTNMNSEARCFVDLFRICKPDEFGLVSRSRFTESLRNKFDLSAGELGTLFTYADAEGRGELDYHQFRRALRRLDTIEASDGGSSGSSGSMGGERRRGKRAVRPAGDDKAVGLRFHQQRKHLGTLSRAAREEFRRRAHLLSAIENNGRALKRAFERSEEVGDGKAVRTCVTWRELERGLEQCLGLTLDAAQLRDMYGKDGEAGLTYSQLASRTVNYFREFNGDAPDARAAKLELRGTYLGCRKLQPSSYRSTVSHFLRGPEYADDVGGAAAAAALPPPTSDSFRSDGVRAALTPIGGPPRAMASREEGRMLSPAPLSLHSSASAAALTTTSAAMAGGAAVAASRVPARMARPWKVRWVDKTLPRSTTKALGGTARARSKFAGYRQGTLNVMHWETATLSKSSSAPALRAPFAKDSDP